MFHRAVNNQPAERIFYGLRWQSAAATPLSTLQKRLEIPRRRKSRAASKRRRARVPSCRRTPYRNDPRGITPLITVAPASKARYIGGVEVDIRSQTREELLSQLALWGQPAYRAGQVLEWLYDRCAAAWDEMTNLPKVLREQLRQTYALGALELVRRQGASDTTRKFLWRLTDGALVESVLVPASPRDRKSTRLNSSHRMPSRMPSSA